MKYSNLINELTPSRSVRLDKGIVAEVVESATMSFDAEERK